jgi:hypothetical protein
MEDGENNFQMDLRETDFGMEGGWNRNRIVSNVFVLAVLKIWALLPKNWLHLCDKCLLKSYNCAKN